MVGALILRGTSGEILFDVGLSGPAGLIGFRRAIGFLASAAFTDGWEALVPLRVAGFRVGFDGAELTADAARMTTMMISFPSDLYISRRQLLDFTKTWKK